ncbi:PEPxxWA-CTERM sorting domain-containing protein [Phenylobacterium sp.]|uniref:PEPxxWA-CTERM sorting domain-containing protein n=1 Tax=Phenylobacterium sp. TaxID=1871053 RepID=UPI0025DEFA7C|nr:PEPxxWA-CTERM sorting domain-containing protein [Phenylobacterium sp.]
MKKFLTTAAVAAAALAAANAASAAVIITQGNLPGSLDTVLIDGADTGTDNVILGLSNEGWTVQVTGDEVIVPSNHGGGQVWVAGADGGLTYLDISTPGATFTAAEININAPRQTLWSITLQGFNAAGVAFTQYVDKNMNPYPAGPVGFEDITNNSFFNFKATDGDVFTHVSFQTSGDVAVGQIRLGALTAVPEPTTWALMILGFGAAGAALRRRRMVLA